MYNVECTMNEKPRNLEIEGHLLQIKKIGNSLGFILPKDLLARLKLKEGDKLHVVERFTLDPKTMKLTRTYEADDPMYLKSMYKGSDVVGIADAPYAKDNCKEQGFINYSKQVRD